MKAVLAAFSMQEACSTAARSIILEIESTMEETEGRSSESDIYLSISDIVYASENRTFQTKQHHNLKTVGSLSW